MNAAEIKTRLARRSGDLAELGVASISLFGSAARGSSTETSDLDFLVEFRGLATFDGYMGLIELLEQEFGVAIDPVTTNALKLFLRESVTCRAVRVA